MTRDFEATVDECVVAAVAAAGEKNVPPAPTPKNNPSETKQQGDKTATKSPVAAGAAAPVTNTKADIADTKAAAATTTKAVPNATAAASDKNAKKEPESATLAAKSPIPNANAKPAKKGNNSSNSKKSAGK